MTAEKQKEEDFCRYDGLSVCLFYSTGHGSKLPVLINYKELPRLKVTKYDVVHLGEEKVHE